MSATDYTPIEPLETWLTAKPFWEQFVWKLNLEKDALTEEDVNSCYRDLSEHLGLIPASPDKKPTISFKYEIDGRPEVTDSRTKIKILEIKEVQSVNALSADCSITFGPHLTLVYGVNGSGKSGIGRLLCNACFSRGEREVLPNVKVALAEGLPAGATFTMEGGTDISYKLGDSHGDLKRFSVFDSKSILIHLDQSNRVNFTPSQIKIFDKVADTISRLEEKLTSERNERKKDNPFDSMFLGGATTTVAIYCKAISAATKEEDFLAQANFDPESDEATMAALQHSIEEKTKLDVPKKKKQLATDCKNLEALKTSLEGTLAIFAAVKIQDTNALVRDIIAQRKLTESLSVASFNDGILNTIGSEEWKSLLVAAKALYEKEAVANGGKELSHCLLCHQTLSPDAESLFLNYWKFLGSKAQTELDLLTRRQTVLVQALQAVKAKYPAFHSTDTGVGVLADDDARYLQELKTNFAALEIVLDEWLENIQALREIALSGGPVVDLVRIDSLVQAKSTEEKSLADPSEEITKLTAQLNLLQDKKEVTAVKDAALQYIEFLHWSAKADAVNFASVKRATTKKRTESFLVGVAQNYKGVFNTELEKLGCDFNLVMNTSGDQGNTVKEYRLDFAEDYNPSQILSEGEQNVCSLADFITEVQLDPNNCGIIFDDPVTSLDHERKDKIAQRLAVEALKRQVIIFTHDVVFMSQLVKHSERGAIPVAVHWMRKINGIPGCVEADSSPKLATLAKLKQDSQECVKGFASVGAAKEQERVLGVALDYLRSACEALIEEVLFAGAIERYSDHIRVQNLEEAVFDQEEALKIVELHGRVSESLLAHNRSDTKREKPLSIDDYRLIFGEFEALEKRLKDGRKVAREARKTRKAEKLETKVGW